MQSFIHRYVKSDRPLGWQYQIKNDLVLNYEMSFEKNLLQAKKYFSMNTITNLRIGTLSDRLDIGLTIMAGYFNYAFQKNNSAKWQLYFYEHPLISVIGYDATLQGGVFSKNNLYTIDAKSINRIVFKNHAGIVFSYSKLYFEFFTAFITKEFNTGQVHNYSGLQLSLSL